MLRFEVVSVHARTVLRIQRPDWRCSRVGLIVLTVKARAIRHYTAALGAIGMKIAVPRIDTVFVTSKALKVVGR